MQGPCQLGNPGQYTARGAQTRHQGYMTQHLAPQMLQCVSIHSNPNEHGLRVSTRVRQRAIGRPGSAGVSAFTFQDPAASSASVLKRWQFVGNSAQPVHGPGGREGWLAEGNSPTDPTRQYLAANKPQQQASVPCASEIQTNF